MESMEHDSQPKSILKNRDEHQPDSNTADIERNTRLNANGAGQRSDSVSNEVKMNSPSTRLTWDEANLYLTEQEKNSTMKITEPKTPYAPQYDPAEDADDIAMLDAEDNATRHSGVMRKVEDIPSLDIGVPEQEMEIPNGASRRKVSVSDGPPSSEEQDLDSLSRTPEEEAKHRKFERMRKEHYGGAAAALKRSPSDLPFDEDDVEEESTGN